VLFTAPLFLLLLLALPLFAWVGWPSRGYARGREAVSLILRLLIVILIVLSLAGLEQKQAADKLSVVYLVDVSDSMPIAAQRAALAYVRAALQNMGAGDKSAVILFGGEALVERPLSASKDLENFTSSLSTLQTDLAEAIRLGMALLPVDTARRMVILSDGIETSGDALKAAQLAARSGAQMMVVPFRLAADKLAEAIVTEVHAPTHLRQGENFSLEVAIDSSVEQPVGLRVLAGNAVVAETTLPLRKGLHRYAIPLTAGDPGFASYRVQIIPLAPNDTFYQNNELAAYSQVAGPPRVLVVKNPAPRDGVNETQELLAALRGANIVVDEVDAYGLPSELPRLAEYASVVLVDVPARTLTPRQMTALQTYVRDLGGGLVAVGGPESYGVGGYFKTPLEDTLPVEMQIKDQKRRPKLTIVFIIDHSGSMSEISGGVEKVELAKEATIRSLDLLFPTDKVGVIQFDDSASWVAPIQSLENKGAIVNLIGTIRSAGGTDIFSGVKAAAEQLPQDDSTVKHIILLTDGQASPTGLPELVKQLHDDYGITLSTVAMGRDADQQLLQRLAEIGEGLYHYAADPASVPTIFTEETTLATRAYIIEEEFFPQQTNPSPILAGITSVPKLLGYIGTTTKDSAQAILISAQKDPILASWQYGLGRAVAWTSDATGRWSKNWVSWEPYARFWAQLVRYTINDEVQSNTDVAVQREGDTATVVVDARTDSGAYLNGVTVQANVIAPDGTTQIITLTQTASGQYVGDFTPTSEGAYLIRVTGSDPSGTITNTAVAQTAGWVLSYSPEYETFNADPNFLKSLATATNGAVVGEDLAAIYKHDLEAPHAATRPLWPLLLTLAVCLLPVDIAARRLILTRHDLERAWAKARAWLTVRAPQPMNIPQRSSQINSLFQAKDRAGTTRPDTPDSTPPSLVVPPIVTTPPNESPRPTSPANAPAESPVSPPPPPASGPAPASTSAALLARKKAREKNDTSRTDG
jgi:uncharacterized membrane protein